MRISFNCVFGRSGEQGLKELKVHCFSAETTDSGIRSIFSSNTHDSLFSRGALSSYSWRTIAGNGRALRKLYLDIFQHCYTLSVLSRGSLLRLRDQFEGLSYL